MAHPTLRESAKRRLERAETLNPEAWAKEVEEARKRGYHLVRYPGLTVEIGDYSLPPMDPEIVSAE